LTWCEILNANIYDKGANGLSVKIVQEENIDSLIRVFACFSFLKNVRIPRDNAILWDIKGNTGYCIQAMFIGKTGYGKSTTLNKICGKELFKTDEIQSCTKTVFSAEYKIHNKKNHYFSLCDLPGMGESMDVDKIYAEYYTKMMEKSHCIIYVIRADQRDYYAKGMEILEPLLKNQKQLKKILLAVNYVDKIEPLKKNCLKYKHGERTSSVEVTKNRDFGMTGVLHSQVIMYSELP